MREWDVVATLSLSPSPYAPISTPLNWASSPSDFFPPSSRIFGRGLSIMCALIECVNYTRAGCSREAEMHQGSSCMNCTGTRMNPSCLSGRFSSLSLLSHHRHRRKFTADFKSTGAWSVQKRNSPRYMTPVHQMKDDHKSLLSYKPNGFKNFHWLDEGPHTPLHTCPAASKLSERCKSFSSSSIVSAVFLLIQKKSRAVRIWCIPLDIFGRTPQLNLSLLPESSLDCWALPSFSSSPRLKRCRDRQFLLGVKRVPYMRNQEVNLDFKLANSGRCRRTATEQAGTQEQSIPIVCSRTLWKGQFPSETWQVSMGVELTLNIRQASCSKSCLRYH